jgi:hypothetical protein
MPKLNTTIDNIELKSNKVKNATAVSSSWTDDQYVSAKTLYNIYNRILHPVGSIITTASNTNPASTLGGTWELVDKAFRNAYFYDYDIFWHSPNGVADLGTNCSAALVDHLFSLRLMITTNVVLNDTAVIIGELGFEDLGISRLHYTILQGVAVSDDGQCTINYSINCETGEITINDVINANGLHELPAGSTFYISIQEAIPATFMIDSYCDKFYWKRTK